MLTYGEPKNTEMKNIVALLITILIAVSGCKKTYGPGPTDPNHQYNNPTVAQLTIVSATQHVETYPADPSSAQLEIDVTLAAANGNIYIPIAYDGNTRNPGYYLQTTDSTVTATPWVGVDPAMVQVDQNVYMIQQGQTATIRVFESLIATRSGTHQMGINKIAYITDSQRNLQYANVSVMTSAVTLNP